MKIEENVKPFTDDEGNIVAALVDGREDAPKDVQELVKITGRSKTTIYKLANKLGRLPTVEEVLNRPNGRPKKYQ